MKTSTHRLASVLAPCLAAFAAGSLTAQTNLTLPTPIPGAFEDFQSFAEGADLSAAGWTVTNFTSEINLEPSLDDPTSLSYANWLVINTNRLLTLPLEASRRLQVAPDQVINGTAVTALLQDNFIYAESDTRGGSQVQFLESPDFNCTGKTGVTLVFYSAYEQNQDSMGAVEYSVDRGETWLPIAYLIDRDDIVRDEFGNVDAESTLMTNHGDVATYSNLDGEFFGGTYGSFIKAPISPELAPFIQGRVNDNTTESKRVEVYRLAAADSQSAVRLRFAHAGTGSWYWGLDNIGLYSIPPKSAPQRPSVTAPASASFFSSNVTVTTPAFAASDPGQKHALSVWQVALEGAAFTPETGFAAPLQEISSTTALTSLALNLERFFPGQSLRVSVRHQDQFANKSAFAEPALINLSSTFPPLVPGTFENFESTAEFETPAGWTAENQSDELTYPGWFVASTDTVGGLGGRRTQVPDALDGQSLFGESDTQSGQQIMFITTPEYNLTGRSGIWVAFRSNYEQNQDSFGGLEYSTDGGTSWQPIVYMIDASDILRKPDGTVDTIATLTTPYGDLARIIGEDGERIPLGSYADFILARPLDNLGPFISGRLNDDPIESKRYERFRVAGVDNQARVSFRFTHTGTGSWYWGVDDFGIYSESALPPTTPLVITSLSLLPPAAGGPSPVELKWSSVAGQKYAVQSSTTLGVWTTLQTGITATSAETSFTDTSLTTADSARFYRVQQQP